MVFPMEQKYLKSCLDNTTENAAKSELSIDIHQQLLKFDQ